MKLTDEQKTTARSNIERIKERAAEAFKMAKDNVLVPMSVRVSTAVSEHTEKDEQGKDQATELVVVRARSLDKEDHAIIIERDAFRRMATALALTEILSDDDIDMPEELRGILESLYEERCAEYMGEFDDPDFALEIPNGSLIHPVNKSVH